MFYHQKVAMVRVFADVPNFALCARHYQSRTNLVEWQLHSGAKWEKIVTKWFKMGESRTNIVDGGLQSGTRWDKVGQSGTKRDKVGQN